MAEIQFNVNMDLVDKYVPAEDITIPQEDNLSVKFTYSIFNREVAEDLTGATDIVVSYVKPDGHIVLQSNGTLELPNKVNIVANAQAFTYVGKVYMQVQYKKGTNTFNTRQAFFWVERSNTSCQTIASADFAPYLDNVVATGEALDGLDLQALIDSKQTAENAQADIDLTLKPSLDAVTQDVSTLETSVNGLNTQVGTINTNVGVLTSGLDSVNSDVGTLSADVSNMEGSLNGMNSTVNSLSVQVGTISSDVNNLESGLSNTNTQVNTLDTQLTSVTNEVGTVNSNLGNLILQVDTIDDSVGSLESGLTSANSSINSLDTQVGSLNTNVGTLTSGLNNTNSQVSTLNTQVGTINTSIGTLTSDISSVSSDVSTINTNVNNLETSLDGTNTAVSALGVQVGTISGDVDILESGLSSTNSQVSTLDTQVSGLSNDVSSVSSGLSTTNSNLSTLSNNFNVVSDKLGKLFVSYADFGAALDGVTDDTIPIRNAHNYANSNGIPVIQRNSIFVLNGQIEVKTNTDLTGSTAVTSWLQDVYEYDRTNVLYNVTGAPLVNITSSVNQAEFAKGVLTIPSLANINSSAIIIESTATDLIRNDGGNTGIVYKTEANMIMKNSTGSLVYPLTKDYTSATSFKVSTRELENQLTFIAPTINLVNAGLSSIFRIQRNNTLIEGGLVKEVSNLTNYKAPVYSFAKAERCCNVIVNNSIAPTIGREIKTGEYGLGYFLLFDRVCGIVVNKAEQQAGWSSVNGNYFRDIKVSSSKLIYVGGHANVYDISVRDSFITQRVGAHGGGLMEISDCVFTGTPTMSAVETRLDYAAEWDGTIRITNTKTLQSRRLVTLNNVSYECGRQAVLPNVEIFNCTMENVADVDIHAVDFRGWTGNYLTTLPSFNINGLTLKTSTNKFNGVILLPNVTNTAISGTINITADNIKSSEASYLTDIFSGSRANFLIPNITNSNVFAKLDIRNSIANFSVTGTSNVTATVRNSDAYILRATSGANNITTVGNPLSITYDNCNLHRLPCDMGSVAGAPDRIKLQFTNSRWLRLRRLNGTIDNVIGFTTENLICYSRNNVVDPAGTLPATNADRLFNYSDPTIWRTSV